MACRIFIQFRTNLVPGDPAQKPIAVAKAACSKLLGRDFDYEKDFIHAQGEILAENARCHALVDCDYRDSEPNLKDITLHCYRVTKEGEGQMSLLETNVHRGQIDVVPWGRHSF